MTTLREAAQKFDPLDLLAGMLFADSDEQTTYVSSGGARETSLGMKYEEVDAGRALRFEPMAPKRAHTFDLVDDDRIFAVHPDYLVRHPAETIGASAEIVLLKHDRLAWAGMRRLHKTPRGVWVAKPRSVLYEYHYRKVFPDGTSVYNTRVAAIDKSGCPVQTVIVGSNGSGRPDGEQAVLMASIIEDCHRARAIRCELADHASIITSLPMGAQKSVFALRDGPVTPGGRKRAILHHVMRHARRSVSGKDHEVQEHFRGVCRFEIDGLSVTLTANDAPNRSAA